MPLRCARGATRRVGSATGDRALAHGVRRDRRPADDPAWRRHGPRCEGDAPGRERGRVLHQPRHLVGPAGPCDGVGPRALGDPEHVGHGVHDCEDRRARSTSRTSACRAFLYGARPGRAAFVQGLLTNVLNPKAALFYLTFLPQFINPDDNVFVKALFLAGIHVTLGLIWLTTYAYAIERLAALMQGARRGLERVSGVDLVALGVRLALDR
ncbi:MAG TPA: hypothetical protein DCK98_00895 [Chloroflexi bacterium]|nr:hypothetical protein [Chloroflexota bacterium]HAL25394.1 hypothetical protein [Chloroflexota bacterium]